MLKKLLLLAFVAAFATAAGAQVVWSENFDASTTLPAGWSQTTNATDGGWLIGQGTDLSSSYFGIPNNGTNVIATNDDGCNCDKSADILITPSINLTGYVKLYLVYESVFYGGTYQGATEAFDLVASTDGGTTWQDVSPFPTSGSFKAGYFDISGYAGNAAVKFGFRYNDNGGYLYGAALDNIQILVPDSKVKVRTVSPSVGHVIDAIPAYQGGYTKYWAGQPMEVHAFLENRGFVPVTSFDASYTLGGQTFTAHVDSVNIDYGQTYGFGLNFTSPNGPTNGTFSVATSNINGGNDDDPTDNSQNIEFEGIIQPAPGRKVVIEEATGTWCQWCPRGAVMLKYMEDNYPELIAPIAVHNGDPMKVTAYDAWMGTQIGGYPSGLVDRAQVNGSVALDPLEFESAFMLETAKAPHALVTQDVGYNATTHKATIISHVHFVDAISDDLRLAVVITEDSVKGTATTYNQANAYGNNANGPMGGFEGLATTVPAAAMIYNHVNRALLGAATGVVGSLPAPLTAGLDIDYTNTFTVPTTYHLNKMSIITMVINNTTGEIVNAERTPIPFGFVATHEAVTPIEMNVFPNPVSNVVNVKFTLPAASDVRVNINDINGKILMENFYSNLSGDQQMAIPVGKIPAGTYLLTVSAKGQSSTQQVVILR
jgi:hypothetical protein